MKEMPFIDVINYCILYAFYSKSKIEKLYCLILKQIEKVVVKSAIAKQLTILYFMQFEKVENYI